MPTWSNWSGKQRAQPAAVHFLRSEEDAIALVRAAATDGRRVRAAGSGHSHAPLVISDGVIVDTTGLSGVIDVDLAARRAWVWAGSPICALGRPLHEAGLALHNQGDIDRQAIAGAVATGTHGTGITLANLSSAVTGARIVLAGGHTVTCSERERPDLWQVARLNLGAIGIVTRLELALRGPYRLAEQAWTAPYGEVRAAIPELIDAHRHFEFFWYPGTDQARVKTIDETEQPPAYPLAAEGERRAWSYEVLPNHRPHKHTEMEYSVPLAAGPDCMDAIRRLIRDRFADLQWPVEYRTLAADDVWLSNAWARPTVTISVHQAVDEDDEPYFRACESVFLEHDGRPHWGKVHYLGRDALAAAYPQWADWWRVRDGADPDGLFLNPYLQALRPD